MAGLDSGEVVFLQPLTLGLVGGPLLGHMDAVTSCRFLPSSSLVVTASSEGTARLWDPASHRSIGERLVGHEGSVSDCTEVALPGGPAVVTAGEDSTIRFWSTATGESLAPRIVAFSAIGIAELVFPDGSNFQFESTASSVDECADLVRPRVGPH